MSKAYDPEFHFNHKKPWLTNEIQYLKEMRGYKSLQDISLALGRTYKAVADMVYRLKKAGDL